MGRYGESWSAPSSLGRMMGYADPWVWLFLVVFLAPSCGGVDEALAVVQVVRYGGRQP